MARGREMGRKREKIRGRDWVGEGEWAIGRREGQRKQRWGKARIWRCTWIKDTYQIFKNKK